MNSRLSDKKLLKKIFWHWLNDLDIKFHVVFSLLTDGKSNDEVLSMLNSFMPDLHEFTKDRAENRFLLRKLIIIVTAILIISNKRLTDRRVINEWGNKFEWLNINRAETDNAFNGLSNWKYWIKEVGHNEIAQYENKLLEEYQVTESDKQIYTNLIDYTRQLEVVEHYDKLHNLYLLFGEDIKNLLKSATQDREALVEFFVKFNILKVDFFQPFIKQLLDKEDSEKRLAFLLYISSSTHTFSRLMRPIGEYNQYYQSSCFKEFAKIKDMASSDCSTDEVKKFINQQLKNAYSYVLKFSGWRKENADLELETIERIVIEKSRREAKELCAGSAMAAFFSAPREIGLNIAEYLEATDYSNCLLLNHKTNNAAHKDLDSIPPGFGKFCRVTADTAALESRSSIKRGKR